MIILVALPVIGHAQIGEANICHTVVQMNRYGQIVDDKLLIKQVNILWRYKIYARL